LSAKSPEFVPSVKTLTTKITWSDIEKLPIGNVHIRTVSRNDGSDLKFLHVAWINGPNISTWCEQEKITNDMKEARDIEKACLKLLKKTIALKEFIELENIGKRILREVHLSQRNSLERSYEYNFKNAFEQYYRKNEGSYVKGETILTTALIEKIMTEFLRGINYYKDLKTTIIDYAKYRHTEFRYDFVSPEGNEVSFVIFPYILPEDKSFSECVNHKASITIKNSDFAEGKYQTCRWRT